jgi:hypothetical protein
MELTASTLGESLEFNADGRHYYVFSDYADGCQYIRNGRELCNEGLHITLSAYDYHVLMDFREIWDDDFGTWGKLCHQLGGAGVASIDEEVKQIRYAVLIDTLRIHLEMSHALLAEGFDGLSPKDAAVARDGFAAREDTFLAELAKTVGIDAVQPETAQALGKELEYLEAEIGRKKPLLLGETSRLLVAAWLALHRVGAFAVDGDSSVLVQRYGLERPLQEELSGEATAEGDTLAELEVPTVMALFRILLRPVNFFSTHLNSLAESLPDLLKDRDVVLFIGLHEGDGHEWFIKERFVIMLLWLEFAARLSAIGNNENFDEKEADRATKLLTAVAESAGYRLDRFLKEFAC